jgi:hypothetical protein
MFRGNSRATSVLVDMLTTLGLERWKSCTEERSEGSRAARRLW